MRIKDSDRSLDGRDLETGRQVRVSTRGGRRKPVRRSPASRVDRAACVERPRVHASHGLALELTYLRPVRSPGAAKAATRARRGTQGARVAWDHDFRLSCAAGAGWR